MIEIDTEKIPIKIWLTILRKQDKINIGLGGNENVYI